MMDLLYWREPLWLLVSLVPFLAYGAARFRVHQRWGRYIDPTMRAWAEPPERVRRGMARRGLLLLAWLLLCIALAGPRTPHWIPPEARPGTAAVVVMDLSLSMAARDERPDRRSRAQALLAKWAGELPETLHLGIVVYAGHAHSVLTPTADHQLARHFVDEVVGIQMPTLGNALGEALRIASVKLDDTGGSAIERRVLLLSDGDLDQAARQSAEAAVSEALLPSATRLQVVGVGGDEAVSVPRNATEALVVDGRPVTSRRDGEWLAHLATLGGGDYLAAEQLAEKAAADVLGLSASRIDPDAQQEALWDEWFVIPLGLGMLLCLIALEGRRSSKLTAAAIAMVALAISTGGCESGVSADEGIDAARKALQSGDFEQARQQVAADEGYDARFIEGVACYRLKDYPCAMQAFARAAWLAPDDTARGRAVFNLGNAHFRLGDYAQASVLFAEAGALGVKPEDAALNRSFADSLAAAVERQLADNAEALRRAEWRAEAFGIPDELLDRLVEGETLSDPLQRNPAFATLSPDTLRTMIARGIAQAAGTDGTSGAGWRWVKTTDSDAPLGTAGLLNHLLPMEAGIVSSADLPFAIEGQRPW